MQLFPHEPFAERIWALRQNVTCYGARYVAVAESVDAPLATLDARLAKAAGPRVHPHSDGESHSPLNLVGLAGFEPAASCTQSRRASQAALQPVSRSQCSGLLLHDSRRRAAVLA